MSALRLRLLERRLSLTSDSARLRGRLVEHSRRIGPVLSGADRVMSAVKWLRDHPLVPVAAAGLLMLKRPRSLLRWGMRAWSGWRLMMRWRQGAREKGWF